MASLEVKSKKFYPLFSLGSQGFGITIVILFFSGKFLLLEGMMGCWDVGMLGCWDFPYFDTLNIWILGFCDFYILMLQSV